MTRRAVVLVDGEHYPPVVRAALDGLAATGTCVIAAVFLGGGEKIARAGGEVDLGVPVEWLGAPGDPPLRAAADPPAAAAALAAILGRLGPEVVVDLSDEPVVDAATRMRLACAALHAGCGYEGPDFAFTPPPRPQVATRPSIAVIGVGKRTGKTAVAGELARRLADAGHEPVVVAMGRGGPAEPVVIPAGRAPDAAALLAVADRGGHAASDFYEDAVTTGVATVGARRCGGGLAGAVGRSNVVEAVRAANGLPGDVLVIEGSGAAVPPVHSDATLLVVPGDAAPETVTGHLQPYRVLLADVVVATMCEPPKASADQVEALSEAIRSISRRVPVVRTVFRPVPLGPVRGTRVFFATTAPAEVGASLTASLEGNFGCEVTGLSTNLADREALTRDLRVAPGFEVLLVELKAAAVDVASRAAVAAGARVVFCDNRPRVVGEREVAGDGDDGTLSAVAERLRRIAARRFAAHGPSGRGQRSGQ